MGAGITVNYQNMVPLFDVGFWKVSSAQHKTTNQQVSIWQIDYDSIQKMEKKSDREKFLNNCLQSVQQMRRIHHPLVLKIIELSESIKALNFASEPVMSCLTLEDSFTPDDASFIAYQLAQVVKFVHQNMHTVLFGLSTDSVVLTSTLDLKLCDFTYSAPIINEYGISIIRAGQWAFSPFMPKLNFTSPEVINNLQTSSQADIFSYAMTIAAAYIGRPLLSCSSIDEYLRVIQSRSIQFPPSIPQEVRDLIFNCLSPFPDTRPDMNKILQNEIFQSLPLKALQYIEVIVTKTDEDRYTFYQGVAKVLSVFSIRILQSRFLPLFIEDVLREPRFGPVLVPQIFEIGRSMDSFSFYQDIVVPLQPLFTKSDNPECLLAILASIPTIVDNINEYQYQQTCFPMLSTAFASNISALHEEALSHIPLIVSKISNTTVEGELIPSIVELFSTSTDIKIVSSCIKCIAKCLPKLNHDIIAETVTEKITAAWNRLSGPPEIADAVLVIIKQLRATSLNSVRFIVPMVSEILASDRIDPPTQLALSQYILEMVNQYVKNHSSSSSSGFGSNNNSNQWLNKINKNKPKLSNPNMSIDQFKKTVDSSDSSQVSFSSLRRQSYDPHDSQVKSRFGNNQVPPSNLGLTNNQATLSTPEFDQNENKAAPSLFAGMKTVQPGDQTKKAPANSMFSGLNVGPARK